MSFSLKIYAIRDNKVSVYRTPFFNENVQDALRGLQITANDGQSQIFHFPGDFDLYQLGELNVITGVITPCEPPTFIQSAASFRKQNIEDTKVLDMEKFKGKDKK